MVAQSLILNCKHLFLFQDVIIHVQDLSHPCHVAQRNHVEATLRSLAFNMSSVDSTASQLPPIINVYNKCDLIPGKSQPTSESDHHISARTQMGLDSLLVDIEQQILLATGRKKLKMRVPNGGQEMAWLYKNAAVVETMADEKNSEWLMMQVVITQRTLDQFKKKFC